MNQTENEFPSQLNKPAWGGFLWVALIVVVIVLFLLIRGSNSSNRLIKPLLPTETANALQIDYAPLTVEFSEIGADPVQYRDQRIQVTGRFSQIEQPDCRPYAGPEISWGLIHDTLQMNAIGYESIVKALPDNSEMTVVGIWTFYSSSVGCGKEPTEQEGIWYLKVEHILQPNPIVYSDSIITTQVNITEDDGSPEEAPTIGATSVGGDSSGAAQTTTATAVPIEDATTATSTPPGAAGGTATATANSENPVGTIAPTNTATTTPTAVSTVPSGSTSTPTPTATAVSGSSTSTPAPTATSGSSGPPPAPTATPGAGYPPPGGGGGGYP